MIRTPTAASAANTFFFCDAGSVTMTGGGNGVPVGEVDG
jgi:hypothetical protein